MPVLERFILGLDTYSGEVHVKIKQARFVTSAINDRDFAMRELPHIAIVGKSNVGKSSLINGLANQKKLAKTSQQAGKTRLINVYLFNEDFYLVDLPGYGYAEVSRKTQEDWNRMMNEFLVNSDNIAHILHLIDIRHEPGNHDKDVFEWICKAGIPYTVVATKADKLSKMQQQKSILQISRSLEIEPSEVLAFSSVSKQGKDELVDRLGKVLDQ